MRYAYCLAILASVSCLRPAWSTDSWHQFRGPGALGVADHPQLPESWSPGENVRWVTELPGRGWSSPVVWGDRIFLTTVVADGESEPPKLNREFKLLHTNSLAEDQMCMATPAIVDDRLIIRAAQRVYCLQRPDGN